MNNFIGEGFFSDVQIPFRDLDPTKKPTRDVNRFQQMISIPYR